MRRLCLLVIVGLGAWGIFPARAQEEATPIEVGENVLGELSVDSPTLHFSITSQDTAPLTLEAQSLTSGFAPMILLYNAQKRLIGREQNPLGAARIRLSFTPQAGAVYTAQIFGFAGQPGQFVLSLSIGESAQISLSELRSGQSIQDFVTPEKPIKRYQVISSPQAALLVQVTSALPDGGAGIILSRNDGEILGTARQTLLGGAFFIPASAPIPYQITVIHSGADRVERFNLSVLPFRNDTPVTAAIGEQTRPTPTLQTPPLQTQPTLAVPTTTPAPTNPPPQAILPPDGECAVTPLEMDEGVNVRRGPGLDYATVAALHPGEVLFVTGRNEDSTWWQVEYNPDQYGWVADNVVRRGGDCGKIGVAEYPPLNSEATPSS